MKSAQVHSGQGHLGSDRISPSPLCHLNCLSFVSAGQNKSDVHMKDGAWPSFSSADLFPSGPRGLCYGPHKSVSCFTVTMLCLICQAEFVGKFFLRVTETQHSVF